MFFEEKSDLNALSTTMTDMNSGEQPKAAKRPCIDDDNTNGTEQAASACMQTVCQALTNELVARALGFLSVQDVLRARVCRSLRATSKLVTPSDRLVVRQRYTFSRWLSVWRRCGRDVLPKLEEVRIETMVALSSLLQFEHLKRLSIAPNLGLYYDDLGPLHRLERLDVTYSRDDDPLFLREIARLTNLQELCLQPRSDLDSGRVLGNLSFLSGLHKLTYLRLSSDFIEGGLLNLAELPSLSLLDLRDCSNVSGDIRDIEPHHFPSLKILKIEWTQIYGRLGTPVMSIDDASVLFTAWNRVLSQPRPLSMIEGSKMPWAKLDKSSPARR